MFDPGFLFDLIWGPGPDRAPAPTALFSAHVWRTESLGLRRRSVAMFTTRSVLGALPPQSCSSVPDHAGCLARPSKSLAAACVVPSPLVAGLEPVDPSRVERPLFTGWAPRRTAPAVRTPTAPCCSGTSAPRRSCAGWPRSGWNARSGSTPTSMSRCGYANPAVCVACGRGARGVTLAQRACRAWQ